MIVTTRPHEQIDDTRSATFPGRKIICQIVVEMKQDGRRQRLNLYTGGVKCERQPVIPPKSTNMPTVVAFDMIDCRSFKKESINA